MTTVAKFVNLQECGVGKVLATYFTEGFSPVWRRMWISKSLFEMRCCHKRHKLESKRRFSPVWRQIWTLKSLFDIKRCHKCHKSRVTSPKRGFSPLSKSQSLHLFGFSLQGCKVTWTEPTWGKVHWNICGKKFISKIGLKKHLPRHSGERSHHNRFWHQLFCHVFDRSQNGTLWLRSQPSCHNYHLFLQWHFLHPDLWKFFYSCSRWKRLKCDKCKKIIKTKDYLKQHVKICVRGGG